MALPADIYIFNLPCPLDQATAEMQQVCSTFGDVTLVRRESVSLSARGDKLGAIRVCFEEHEDAVAAAGNMNGMVYRWSPDSPEQGERSAVLKVLTLDELRRCQKRGAH